MSAKCTENSALATDNDHGFFNIIDKEHALVEQLHSLHLLATLGWKVTMAESVAFMFLPLQWQIHILYLQNPRSVNSSDIVSYNDF